MDTLYYIQSFKKRKLTGENVSYINGQEGKSGPQHIMDQIKTTLNLTLDTDITVPLTSEVLAEIPTGPPITKVSDIDMETLDVNTMNISLSIEALIEQYGPGGGGSGY